MTDFAFPSAARLHTSEDFDRVYREGYRLWVYPLGAQVLPKESGGSRLGLAVSKKVGGTVVRNRWKRAIREAFRLNRHRLDLPHDMVMMVDWDAGENDLAKVEEAFLEMVRRLNERARGED